MVPFISNDVASEVLADIGAGGCCVLKQDPDVEFADLFTIMSLQKAPRLSSRQIETMTWSALSRSISDLASCRHSAS